MTEEEFKEYWRSLDKKTREELKEIIIARIKSMPDNLRLSIG